MKTYVQLARAAEIAALGVVISAMAMVARGWELLPEQLTVPMGTAGERLVAIGGKAFLLWLMLAMLAVYLLLSVFMRFHRLYSYPVRISPQNRENQQQLLKSFISLLKLELTALLAYFICVILLGSIRAYAAWFDLWFFLMAAFIMGVTAGSYFWLAWRYR